jgi:hypothetical protein
MKGGLAFIFLTFNYVNFFAAPSITGFSMTPPSCYGLSNGTATVLITGGTGPFSFSWTGTSQTTQTVTSLSAGAHTVTVTDNFDMTTVTGSMYMNQPSVLNGFTNNGDSICLGTSTTLYAAGSGGTPPYNYNWSPSVGIGGGPFAVTPSVTGMNYYTVNITDANGCIAAPLTIEVFVYPTVISVITSASPSSCSTCPDGSASVSGTGGTGGPYTYDWSPLSCTTPVCTGLLPGNYDVCVYDECNNYSCETATVGVATSVYEFEDEESLITVWPNPFSEIVSFTFTRELHETYSFEMTDVSGKKVRAIDGISEKQFTISKNELQNGIYFYKIYSSKTVVGIGKLIIK